jgi:hypothetical protein
LLALPIASFLSISKRDKLLIHHGHLLPGNSARNQFALVQKYDLPRTEAKELSLLLSQIGSWVLSRGKLISKEDPERIVRVVKALVG